MASEITITLTGDETEVQFAGANAWLRNDGAATIYAAKTSGVTAGADGVVSVPAGGSAPLYGANGRVFLLGTGSVQLIGSDYSTNPFKTATSSGGSGVDEVARAAVNAHAGNSEIHVTADEKASWNGKADASDIPTSLPANGGNADTVGGKNVSEYGLEGVATIVQDYGVMDIGAIIDFNTAPGQDYDGRIARDNGAFDFFNSDNSKATLWANLDGSAASVGVYTEDKLAALEARVAALEGGT